MKILLAALVFLATFVTFTSAEASLQTKLIEELKAPDLTTHKKLLQKLKGYHIVFVAIKGMPGVFLRSFQDAKDFLRSGGVANISTIKVPFLKAYEDNHCDLADELYRIHQEVKRPLLVIGNPLAGADALYAVLRDPNLITSGVVAQLVVINGVMLGTPLVEESTRFAVNKSAPLFRQAISYLRPSDAEAMKRALYYVRGEVRTKRPKHLFFGITRDVAKFNGPNDGVSLTKNQLLRDSKNEVLGQDLGVLDADHWDLTAYPMGEFNPRMLWVRRAFIVALLRETLRVD